MSFFRLILPAFAIAQGCGAPGATTSTTTPTVSEPARGYEVVGVKEPRPEAKDHPVVLITIDGARWQEVFGGPDGALARSRSMFVANAGQPEKLMPNLHRVIQTRGLALGAPGKGEEMHASGPHYVSLPGYIEIFTGAPATCQTNDCPCIKQRTIVDEARSVSHEAHEVAVFSSWEPISRGISSDVGSIVLSMGRERLQNAAAITSDRKTAHALWMGTETTDNYPGDRHDYRQDEHTARLALRYLTSKRPRFMFVGLGDADEYGHRNDYHGYLGALRAADRFIGDVFTALDNMGERGKKTVVIITTDHGRENAFRGHGGEFPESSRVWMVAAGGDVPLRGMAASPRPLRLYDIAPTIRVLMALPDQPSEGKPIEEITGASDDPRLARP